MKMQTRLMITIVVVFSIFAWSDGFAAMYKYLDKDGMICIADDLQSIPEQYRASAKIVSGDAEAEKKPMQQNHSGARLDTKPESTIPSVTREQAPSEGIKKRFFANRVLISLMVVVSALFAVVILGILDADHKKSVKIVRVVILWGMSVYLIYAHAGDVVYLFSSTRDSISSARQRSADKGEKAAKALKEMNALINSLDNAGSQEPGSVDPEK